jgi:hypothetical protein
LARFSHILNSMRHLHLSYWLAPALIALILWGLSSATAYSKLRGIYRTHFPETPRERLFLAAVGFFVTIAVVRTLTYLIHNKIGPFHDIEMRGRHIHHLVWGIALLLMVGYGWLIEIGTGSRSSNTWAGRAASMVYGVGAALTLDEFALWLNLRDVYWEREGRLSVEAIFLFGALLAIGIFGRRFLHAIGREFVKTIRR